MEFVIHKLLSRPRLTVYSTPLTKDIPNSGASVERVLLKRKAFPQEIADVILFVSSSKASYMLGSVTVVDGGITIT